MDLDVEAAATARELGLTPNAGFAHFQSIAIGLMGDTDVESATLAQERQVRCHARELTATRPPRT